MISAKDEFFLDRERLNEINSMMNEAELSMDERQLIWDLIGDGSSEEAFEWAKKRISDLTNHPLTKIRNGETLSWAQRKEAIRKATDNE